MQLLKINEVAEILSVSEKTIYGWHFRGKHLSFIKVGRSLRIAEEDLRRFIAKNRSNKTWQMKESD